MHPPKMKKVYVLMEMHLGPANNPRGWCLFVIHASPKARCDALDGKRVVLGRDQDSAGSMRRHGGKLGHFLPSQHSTYKPPCPVVWGLRAKTRQAGGSNDPYLGLTGLLVPKAGSESIRIPATLPQASLLQAERISHVVE